MKNINVKLISLLILVLSSISCKAQVFPLDTDVDNIPPNAYLKDLKNELPPYIGTYLANFNGKEIILYITKMENKLEKSTNKNYFLDALIIKYIVKDINGNILKDTQNMSIQTDSISSLWVRSYDNSVILYYSGTNCGVGWGNIYLKKLNATQISWTYYPEETIILPGKCPGNPDLTVYLPVAENVVFIKQ